MNHSEDADRHNENGNALGARLEVITASDVCLRRVAYLWESRIPIGAMTLIPGEEGIGKTTMGIRLMADLTLGRLPGEHYGTPRDVVVLAAEDGLEDVFVPRLQQAGADLSRVHIVRARVAYDEDEGTTRSDVVVPRDLHLIGEVVQQHAAVLVWIDSLVTTLPDDLKSIAYKDVAKVLRKVTTWAEKERIAVAAPWHLNKATGSDTAMRIMDSRAFRTAVRSMLLVVKDPDAEEDDNVGIVALDKANAGTLNVPALRYRITSSPYVVNEVDDDSGELREVQASCGVATWIGVVEGNGLEIARAALAPKVEREGTATAWLRQYLTEHGETPRAEVIAAAASDHSRASVERAARALRVHSRQETGQQADGRPFRESRWSLPSPLTSPLTSPKREGTEGTREGSHEGTGGIVPSQPQSPQFPQSPPWGQNVRALRCRVCGQPLHPLDINDGATRHAGCIDEPNINQSLKEHRS